MGVIFYQFRRFYLLTTRNIKRLEAVGNYNMIIRNSVHDQIILINYLLYSALSPVFSHLSASIDGLTTIRAFEAQQILTNGFDTYQVSETKWLTIYPEIIQNFITLHLGFTYLGLVFVFVL